MVNRDISLVAHGDENTNDEEVTYSMSPLHACGEITLQADDFRKPLSFTQTSRIANTNRLEKLALLILDWNNIH